MPGHMPWVGSHIGFDGIRKFVGDLDAHLIFKHFAADHLYADAECGAVFARGCAVCTARATGRSYQDSFVHFLGFRNLKLTHFREYPDTVWQFAAIFPKPIGNLSQLQPEQIATVLEERGG